MKLRLDANGAWDEAVAIATIRNLELYEIELVEQPVPGDDIEALGRVRDAVTTSIAADEAVFDYESATTALKHADILVLKPARLGGLSVSRYIAKVAAVCRHRRHRHNDHRYRHRHRRGAAPRRLAAGRGRAHGLATASLLETTS